LNYKAKTNIASNYHFVNFTLGTLKSSNVFAKSGYWKYSNMVVLEVSEVIYKDKNRWL